MCCFLFRRRVPGLPPRKKKEKYLSKKQLHESCITELFQAEECFLNFLLLIIESAKGTVLCEVRHKHKAAIALWRYAVGGRHPFGENIHILFSACPWRVEVHNGNECDVIPGAIAIFCLGWRSYQNHSLELFIFGLCQVTLFLNTLIAAPCLIRPLTLPKRRSQRRQAFVNDGVELSPSLEFGFPNKQRS